MEVFRDFAKILRRQKKQKLEVEKEIKPPPQKKKRKGEKKEITR